MKEVVTRLGPWRIERAFGRDVHGTYHSGILDDGARATLYRPSSEIAAARGNPLNQLVELHRALDHRGVVGFRGIGRDGDEPFLIADPVDDALVSLLRGRRPPAIETRTVGVALAAALLAVHERGLVHGGLDLDTAVWAPEHAARILGPGVATLGITGDLAQARGDVVGLGRLLSALIASWPRRSSGWNADEQRTIEIVRVIADPGAGVAMRDAHALLADGARMPAPRASGSAAEPTPVAADAVTTEQTHDYIPGPDVDLVREVGDAADPLHGRLGRYRIVARIGIGGMGEVFLAEDPTLRRGVAIKRIFPQYVQILGIAAPDVRTAMDLRGPADLVRVICDAYSKCVVGSDAGTLTPRIEAGKAIVTDTTFIPCQLQMGVFLGAGQLTGLFRDSALTEKQCRGRGDPVCVYEFAF